MRFLISLIAYFLVNYSLLIAKEVECQGAVLRVLNKTTNEKKSIIPKSIAVKYVMLCSIIIKQLQIPQN